MLIVIYLLLISDRFPTSRKYVTTWGSPEWDGLFYH